MTIKDRRLFIYLSLSCLLACSPGSENDLVQNKTQDLKDKLEKILPDKVLLESVLPTDMDDYYEIHIEGLEPLYVTGNGKYLVSGDIYEISGDGLINKSDARKRHQRKTVLANINSNEFIIFMPKEVKHSVYVFTDVDCGYCRKFHKEIDEYLALGIKVNYLAFPREGLSSESYRKIASAWCSDNPNRALTELKLGRKIDENICIDNPIEKHFKLGNSLGVAGTPSIFTSEGRLIPGYLAPDELLNQLES